MVPAPIYVWSIFPPDVDTWKEHSLDKYHYLLKDKPMCSHAANLEPTTLGKAAIMWPLRKSHALTKSDSVVETDGTPMAIMMRFMMNAYKQHQGQQDPNIHFTTPPPRHRLRDVSPPALQALTMGGAADGRPPLQRTVSSHNFGDVEISKSTH